MFELVGSKETFWNVPDLSWSNLAALPLGSRKNICDELPEQNRITYETINVSQQKRN